MAKTKVLISWAVTTQLICAFVFAYAKSRFSHDMAHIIHVTIQQSLDRELYIHVIHLRRQIRRFSSQNREND